MPPGGSCCPFRKGECREFLAFSGILNFLFNKYECVYFNFFLFVGLPHGPMAENGGRAWDGGVLERSYRRRIKEAAQDARHTKTKRRERDQKGESSPHCQFSWRPDS